MQPVELLTAPWMHNHHHHHWGTQAVLFPKLGPTAHTHTTHNLTKPCQPNATQTKESWARWEGGHLGGVRMSATRCKGRQPRESARRRAAEEKKRRTVLILGQGGKSYKFGQKVKGRKGRNLQYRARGLCVCRLAKVPLRTLRPPRSPGTVTAGPQ
uniref:Uncharacterized protein n=1 Tax=Physcomitrium patens TaxID=3218 RepID=A0A2K1JM17_PHYPA|nr:hypothetical protein PHYPA_017424 [Physcomitrium patens]